ncbi:MAG: DUF2889 domain-containing protein [Formosimonas sp.]
MTEFDTRAANIQQSRITGLPPVHERVLRHRRTFCYEVYERDDGLWDVDAQMLDHKAHSFTVGGASRELGQPLHNMVLRLTLNPSFTIVAVHVQTLSAPYMQQCPAIEPAYQQLLGLNVVKGFRPAVKNLFAGTQGCTHITELANTLPTVVIQGMGTELANRHPQPDKKPFQLDHCHALVTDGEVARQYYPQWYTPK